ncbi:MAG: alpha-amylase [Alphaproteobacteria bacterium]|nr:alpha-amylase [Alphaproteobacteria bacterium]
MRFVVALFAAVFAVSALAPKSDASAPAPKASPADAGAVPERYLPQPYVKVRHPVWARNAVIYQINIRQFTDEGTFAAAEKQLPRLKALGVDILWLMPINPIGEKNRKGTLGSPYSVKDYFAVNPEFGTLNDLKSFVATAHRLGMHVILDWVANHTAWDNPLVREHPDWYERDWKGDFRSTPWFDWSDIIDLDYSRPALREYMTKAMTYWVKEADIDGYRCDTASFVPLDFWNNVRAELDAIKPVFMLAEAEQRDLHQRAFDASYAWSLANALGDIAHGKSDVGALYGYYSENESAWPQAAYRMTFTSNHDFNAWHGSDAELYGAAFDAATVLTFVGEGIPLIYNGQEADNEKRLKFFDKDPIVWKNSPRAALYKKLIALKHDTRALWNGEDGARMVQVTNSAPAKVFSFVRFGKNDGLFAVFNFSPNSQKVTFSQSLHFGAYTDYFSGQSRKFDASSSLTLKPWGYRVFLKK